VADQFGQFFVAQGKGFQPGIQRLAKQVERHALELKPKKSPRRSPRFLDACHGQGDRMDRSDPRGLWQQRSAQHAPVEVRHQHDLRGVKRHGQA